MTQRINESANHSPMNVAIRRTVQGAVPALLLITLFVLSINHPNPEWGKFWMIRPLIITPLAGATGGFIFYLLEKKRAKGANKAATIIASILIYTIGVWMGFVLGLDGTLWN
ncbi:MAG TPA: potassium transporter KefB [Flavobacterium sp.]|jgi:hypothetical protein